jgi:hypothetical protein
MNTFNSGELLICLNENTHAGHYYIDHPYRIVSIENKYGNDIIAIRDKKGEKHHFNYLPESNSYIYNFFRLATHEEAVKWGRPLNSR